MDTLTLRPSFSPSIYSESTRKTVSGSIVLEDNILRYFMNLVNQDSASVSVDTSLLTEQNGKDISFEFEVYSSKQCTINFTGFNIEQYTVLRGLTIFKVVKYGGSSQWIISTKSEDYQRKEERVLTYSTLISDNYYQFNRSSDFHGCFNKGVDEFHHNNVAQIYENRTLIIHSTCGILLTRIQMNCETTSYDFSNRYPSYIKVYGSNDNDTWVIIGSDMNPSYTQSTKYFFEMNCEGNTYFRHFKFEFGAIPNNTYCYVPYTYFWGIKDPNESYIYKRLIPYFTANPQNGAQALFDDTNSTSLSNFPTNWFPNGLGYDSYVSWLDGNQTNPLTFYVKINEAKIPALIGMRHADTYGHTGARFWKLYGSNSETVETEGDDETLSSFKSKTWTLISCNQSEYSYENNEEEYHAIDCNIAYKYYKFECIQTNNYGSTYRHYGILLYYKDFGKIPEFDSLVPNLSSNTQDGYMLNCSSESDGQAYRAFDGKLDTYCGGQFSDGEWSIIVKMAIKTIVSTIEMTAPSSEYNRMPLQFVVEGSNDMTTWDTLYTRNNEDPWNTASERRSWHFENDTGYLWYRLRVLSTLQGTWIRIADIKFGVQEKIPGVSWYSDEYIIPVMSANEQDGYVASAKTEFSSTYAACKAFDRTSNDCWACSDEDKTNSNKECNVWLQIQLPTAEVFNLLNIVSRQSLNSQAPSSFTLKGSNDNETWTDLLTVINESTYSDKTWNFENSTAYSYYRIDIVKTNSANDHVAVAELNLIKRIYHNTLEGE